nr:G-type lectin S-receptor-like serine/threonine-protein kinase LECRK3 [Tanacetum cinerariifolium]
MGPRVFSYGEIERITNGFKEELGRGSCGVVYKGFIENLNKAVAVKKLKGELAHEGEREFQMEMKVIGRTHHRNLMRLLGYCSQGSERLLVLEYMTQGSLADILFKPKESNGKPCWSERIRIAVDIANGILNMDNSLPLDEAIHVEWVYKCYEADEVSKLVDDEDVEKSTLVQMVRIGLWCIQEDPSLHPSMKNVVLMLEGTVKIPEPPNPASFLSVV